jgi:HEAT repeat protein
VVEQVRQLQGDLVLTSRPVGYPGGLESLTHFEVLPLVPDDVDRFLHDWFGVLAAQRKAPDGWVDERVAWLKKQLDERPRIQALTRNPLLLTFLVVLAGDDPVRDLPTQRAELYRRYVEELLDSWEAQRRPISGADGQPALKLGRLMGEDARQAALHGLYRTGWYLHLAYNDAMPGYEPTAAGIIAYLGPFLQTEWGCASGEARSIAQTTLSFWVEAGLLDIWRVENAEYLAFRHLTFQEYAAAWGLHEAYQQDARQAWQFVRPRLHHYAWREPLLLLSTMLEQKHVDALVRRLVQGTSRYEHDLLRDLRLATAMVGEDAPLSPPTIQAWWRKVRSILHGTKPALFSFITHSVLALLLAAIVGYELLIVVLYIGAYFIAFRYGYWRPLILWHRTKWAHNNIGAKLATGGKPALPALQQALQHPVLYQAAATALGQMGIAALPTLQQALHDQKVFVFGRLAVAEALGKIGDPSAIPALQQALRDQGLDIRRQAAAKALGEIGDPAALPALQQALHDQEKYVRLAVAEALGKIGDPSAIPALQQALHDQEKYVRLAVAEALGKIGDPAALPALLQALHDQDWRVRRAAVEALGKIGVAALPALLQALHDQDWGARSAAVEALGKIGVAALPALLQALHDQDWGARSAAVEALGEIGDPSAIPALQQDLHDQDWRVRWAAVEALGKIGDPSAIPALQQALHDQELVIRREFLKALGKLGDPSAIPALQQDLHDQELDIRQDAAWALGEIGDPSAIPALQQDLHDQDWGVRLIVTAALGNVIAASSDIRQVRRTARALWWAASDDAIEALEKTANRLSVLEVQASPGSDPLVSPEPVRQIAWGWAVFVGAVLVAAILVVFLLPADFWQAHVAVAIGTIIGILSGIAGLLGFSLRDVFHSKGE